MTNNRNDPTVDEKRNKFIHQQLIMIYKNTWKLALKGEAQSFEQALPIASQAIINKFKDLSAGYQRELKLLNTVEEYNQYAEKYDLQIAYEVNDQAGKKQIGSLMNTRTDRVIINEVAITAKLKQQKLLQLNLKVLQVKKILASQTKSLSKSAPVPISTQPAQNTPNPRVQIDLTKEDEPEQDNNVYWVDSQTLCDYLQNGSKPTLREDQQWLRQHGWRDRPYPETIRHTSIRHSTLFASHYSSNDNHPHALIKPSNNPGSGANQS